MKKEKINKIVLCPKNVDSVPILFLCTIFLICINIATIYLYANIQFDYRLLLLVFCVDLIICISVFRTNRQWYKYRFTQYGVLRITYHWRKVDLSSETKFIEWKNVKEIYIYNSSYYLDEHKKMMLHIYCINNNKIFFNMEDYYLTANNQQKVDKDLFASFVKDICNVYNIPYHSEI